MRALIAYLIYLPLQILSIPLDIIGASIAYYKQTYVSKKLGAPATAIEIINGCWTMDKFGIRKDEAAAKYPTLKSRKTS